MWGWAGLAPWGHPMASKLFRKPISRGWQQMPGFITSPRALPQGMSQHLPHSQAANAPPSSRGEVPVQLTPSKPISVVRHKIQEINGSLHCREAPSKISLGRAARRCWPGCEQGWVRSSTALQTRRRKLTSTCNISVRKIPLGMELLGVPRGFAQPGMDNAAFPSGSSNRLRNLCCFCC